MQALHAAAAIKATVHAVGAAVREFCGLAPWPCTYRLVDIVATSVVPQHFIEEILAI
jgi:hypothetical protein